MDDGGSPTRFYSDDDNEYDDTKLEIKFEDAGALDMSAAKDNIWLTRMPKFTWEALANLKDDDEVQIGTLRMQGDRQAPNKLSLMLDHNVGALRLVPREYNIHRLNKAQSNTYVFTEKDLPGYSRKIPGQGMQASKPTPVDKKETPHARNHRMPGYKKAIPKKTALVGHVNFEYNCLPVENKEYLSTLKKRLAELPTDNSAPDDLKVQTGVGNLGTGARYGFIKVAPTNQKKQQQKAARMPKNELLDKLFTCFQEYKYWRLKDLRSATQQPESFLREVLDGIAELVKQGPLANTWRLKPGTGIDAGRDPSDFAGAQEQVAPARDGLTDGEEDDDTDHVKMEDVQ